IYSRRPTSMPTWASADRTVQRGCEPKAINPLQGEKRERGRFLAGAILAQNEIFSIRNQNSQSPRLPPRSRFVTKYSHISVTKEGARPGSLFVAQVRGRLGSERSPGSGEAEPQGQQGGERHRPQQRTR